MKSVKQRPLAKLALLAVGFIAMLLIVSVYLWGPAVGQPCKNAFPMVVGCTLGKFETLTAGVLAALAALVAGWVAYGSVQLQIATQKQREACRAKAHKANLARALHAELADLVARCCFDSEKPWGDVSESPKFKKTELRRFAPHDPTIFANSGGDLALLGEIAPLRLVQFYNSLNALRRDIHYIADDLTDHPAVESEIRLIRFRFYLTLQPGLDALLALAPMVPSAHQVERAAIDPYDDSQPDRSRPEGELQDRIINVLLRMKSAFQF
jgi:hypothetical protein